MVVGRSFFYFDVKVTVDLQRPNFVIFFFFAHNIAKTSF